MANYNDQHAVRRAVAIDYSGGDQTLSEPCRALYIASAGDLVVLLSGDTATATFTDLLPGMIYPLSVIKIIQSGSGAAGLALF